VTVLCTQSADSSQPFTWHENVQVLPILPFKQPFPQPYAIPAFDMAQIIQQVGDHLQTADRFYMHDGEFLFPYVYQHIPTVVSLRDNVYPETLLGGFLFQADKLILISDYSRQYFEQTVGRFFPDLSERIQVIHNGLDWEKFKPTTPKEILNIIPVNPDKDAIVLHPHRPEATKGIRQTIATADLLVHRHGVDNLKVLAPKWHRAQLTRDLQEFYDAIESEIVERRLQNHFLFHDWIPQDLMPQYYSLGAVMLSLGSFVESFGNAVYESLGCGTPSVVARISTHRELLPDNLIDKVDYDDIKTTAEIVARIIKNHERTKPETKSYLRQRYGIERQLQSYADGIINAKFAPPLEYRHRPLDNIAWFKLPVWCYLTDRGIYHDFRADYRQLDASFLSLAQDNPRGFTLTQANAQGVSTDDVFQLYREGYLVPLFEDI
jgi:glycosyltransferase involved in cell wall biosynthesis